MSKFRNIPTEALTQQLAAAKRLLLAQQARDSLLDYIRLGMPDPDDPENTDVSQYETTPQARLLCQVFEKAAKGELKRVAVSIGPQMGKLLADDTPVLTLKGWRQHGELTPGDSVHHPKLGWTKVVAMSEPGDASLEVRTTHGDNIAAHPRHEWVVRFGPTPEWRVVETAELANLVAAGQTVYLPPAATVSSSPRVWAVDIIDPRPGRCIQVDAADGLYVAGRKGTVTHNSEIISRRGPAWFSAKNPRRHFMLGTYNQDFANEFGQWVRRYIRSAYHRQVFEDHRLTRGSAASDHMITELGGQLAFVGVGGSGTGKPADFFVVDDPYRNDDDARSAAYRERVWTWFNSVVFSRCHSNSSIVVVHCLAGDTPVLMADGTERAISDIKPGDKVVGWEKGKQVARRVLNHANQGPDDVFVVRTGNSTIKGNARHPVLVETDAGPQWRAIGALKKGDAVVHVGRSSGPASSAKISADDAWMLGFMFGDGWLTIRDTTQKGYKGRTYPRRAIVTCFAHGDNEGLAATIRGLIEHKFGCELHRTKFGYYRTEKQNVGRWFVEHGLCGNAKSKRVPAWMFSQPDDVRGAFLNGFLAADGCFPAGTDRVQVGLCNGRLVRDMRRLATALGYRPTNVYRYEKELQAPNSPVPIMTTHHRVNWRNRTWHAPFYASPVRSIEPAGREDVFDIEVEGAESFVADQMVVHNTRWNQDDLIGRLCDPDHPERNKAYAGIADEWTYIDLPAIVKDKRLADALGLTLELPSKTISDPRDLAKVVNQFGDVPMSSLWPQRKGLPFLAEARRNSPRIFDALYMGKPAPDDGDYFKAEWLHEYSADELPKALRIYAASDHALKAKEANDATCMGVVGVDERNDIWVLDVRWDRMNTLDQVESMIDMGRRWRPIVWWAGQDHISGSIGPFLKKRMQETGVYLHIAEMPEKGDKEQKAQAFKGFAAMGKVHFPRSAAWWQDARKELLLFPHGAHDDFVDFLSLLGRGLNRQVAAVPTKTVEPPKRGTYAHIKSLYRASAREQKVRTALAGM